MNELRGCTRAERPERLRTMTITADVDLAFAGPAVLAELVRSKEVQPRELVELCLRRIEELDPRLNAFRVTMADEALAAAEAEPSGPLAGVPIAVKDDLPVEGQATTRGSRSYGPPAPADAEAVRRLRAAGAIPIGITNVPELTIFPWTATDANGVSRNPWDITRTPGGSSGGSAAAVAAGLVPCATGSDGGGSIRIPAAACGLVGMKSTRGRVSMAPGRQGWLGLSVYGGLARTVRDSALMLDVMRGTLDSDIDHAPPFDGSYVDADGRRAAAAADRRVEEGAARSDRQALRRTARSVGADRTPAGESRAPRERGQPGLRNGAARVPADVAARHLRRVNRRSRSAAARAADPADGRRGRAPRAGAAPPRPAGEAFADDRPHPRPVGRARRAARRPGSPRRRSRPKVDMGRRRRSRSTSPVGSRRTRRCSTSPGSRRSHCRPESGPTGCR